MYVHLWAELSDGNNFMSGCACTYMEVDWVGGGGMGVGGVVFRLPLPATLTSTPPPASLPVCGRSSSHIIMAITFFYRFSIDLFFILLTFNYHVLYCFLYSRSSLPFVSSLLPLVFVPSHICVDLPSSRLPPFLSIFLSF